MPAIAGVHARADLCGSVRWGACQPGLMLNVGVVAVRGVACVEITAGTRGVILPEVGRFAVVVGHGSA